MGQRNERGDTTVEWETSKNFKIMNTQCFFLSRITGVCGLQLHSHSNMTDRA